MEASRTMEDELRSRSMPLQHQIPTYDHPVQQTMQNLGIHLQHHSVTLLPIRYVWHLQIHIPDCAKFMSRTYQARTTTAHITHVFCKSL